MPTIISTVEDLAERQHGLVTRVQLRAAGVSEAQIQGLLRRRVVRRMRRSVYAICGAPATWEQALLAAVLAGGEGAVASHSAAARLWSLGPVGDIHFEITTTRHHRPHINGVALHQSVHLGDADVVRRAAIRCTTFERTLCDLTGRLTVSELGRALDEGLRRGVASLPRLHDATERLESANGRRMSVVRSLLAARGIGFEPGGSASELRVLRVLRAAGIPLPVQQHRVRVGRRRYVLDYAWPDLRVFAEYYGLAVHSGPSAVAYDSARITDLAVAGWLPLVFTDSTPDAEMVEMTAAALADAGVVSVTDRIGA